MEIGEKDQSRTKEWKLAGLRLFDFDNEIGLTPDFGGVVQDDCARLFVLFVGNRATHAGLRLDEYFVSVLAQSCDHAGHTADASLVILDFLRHTNHHKRSPYSLLLWRTSAEALQNWKM